MHQVELPPHLGPHSSGSPFPLPAGLQRTPPPAFSWHQATPTMLLMVRVMSLTAPLPWAMILAGHWPHIVHLPQHAHLPRAPQPPPRTPEGCGFAELALPLCGCMCCNPQAITRRSDSMLRKGLHVSAFLPIQCLVPASKSTGPSQGVPWSCRDMLWLQRAFPLRPGTSCPVPLGVSTGSCSVG